MILRRLVQELVVDEVLAPAQPAPLPVWWQQGQRGAIDVNVIFNQVVRLPHTVTQQGSAAMAPVSTLGPARAQGLDGSWYVPDMVKKEKG